MDRDNIVRRHDIGPQRKLPQFATLKVIFLLIDSMVRGKMERCWNLYNIAFAVVVIKSFDGEVCKVNLLFGGRLLRKDWLI